MDDAVSQTIPSKLSLVSPRLNKTLSATTIGNIVTSEVTNEATDLQIALGLLTQDSKKVVDKLYGYRVTCRYMRWGNFICLLPMLLIQTLLFRESLTRVLIQIIADNFDADISPPNFGFKTIPTILRSTGKTPDKIL